MCPRCDAARTARERARARAGGDGAPGAMFEHLCATLLQQAHLCPLPLEAQPVVWAHDTGLRLYPLPDALLLADTAPSAHFTFEGTVCINPVRRCSARLCVPSPDWETRRLPYGLMGHIPRALPLRGPACNNQHVSRTLSRH